MGGTPDGRVTLVDENERQSIGGVRKPPPGLVPLGLRGRLGGCLRGRPGSRLGLGSGAHLPGLLGLAVAAVLAVAPAGAAAAGAACIAGDVDGLRKAGFKSHVVPALEAEGGSHGCLRARRGIGVLPAGAGALHGLLLRSGGLLLRGEGECGQRRDDGDDFHIVSLWYGVSNAGQGRALLPLIPGETPQRGLQLPRQGLPVPALTLR